jgi:hypothetical protein
MMRYERQTLVALLCAAGWLLAGACGGSSSSSGSDDDDGAAGASSGSGSGGAASGSGGSLVSDGSAGEFSVALPDDTPVTDLSDEDYLAVCEAAVDYVINAAGPAACTAYIAGDLIQSGATDQEIRMQCAIGVPACVVLLSSMVACAPPGDDCSATVGEMESCVNALGDAGDEISETMPECTELTADTVLPDPASLLSLDNIGNCGTLEQQCPGIIPLDLGALSILGGGGAAGTLPAGSGGASASTAGAGG